MHDNSTEIHVLVKVTRSQHPGEDDFKILGAYSTRDGLEAKLKRIERANPQYPLESVGQNSWRIGPSEDEGFFGNKPVYLEARVTSLT